ncbi:MAG: hypothetical protein ACPGU7_13590 [Gammaproteobacteria bacterium]
MTTPIVEILEVAPEDLPNAIAASGGTLDVAAARPAHDEATVKTDTVFRLNPDVREQLGRIRLPVHCWRLLQQINGRRDVAAVAAQLNATPSQLHADFQRLLCQGLIIESDAMSLEQFRKLPRPDQPTPAAGAGNSTAEETVPGAKTEPSDDTAPDNPAPAAAEVSKSPADQVDSLVGHPRLLACLMDQVRRSRGGGRRGELAVYLMFTRVPAELFRNAGLRSYLYVDEDTRIEDPRLTARLMREAELIVGRALAPAITTCLAHAH